MRAGQTGIAPVRLGAEPSFVRSELLLTEIGDGMEQAGPVGPFR
jgi:hypothetical protein